MNSIMKRKRVLIISAVTVALAAAAIFVYSRPRPNPVTARADPAVMVANAVGVLMRSETHALTGEQIASILPLLRVLRDTDPNDAEVSRALAREINSILTPEQRAEVERMREEARQRREESGSQRQRRAGPGFNPPGDGGSGVQPGGVGRGPGGARSRGEIRQRLIGRLIERLEDRQ
jgi:hypothetical protein